MCPQRRTAAIAQLILHIGDPKTGTSSIQTAMRTDLVHCETRSIAPWHQANAMSLAHAIRNKPGAKHWDADYARVGDWLGDCTTDYAIISSENFSEADPEILYRALEKHCPDHLAEVRVIAYVRPHLSRFLAAYTQRAKVGRFKGGLAEFQMKIGESLDLDYTPKFQRWRDRFDNRFTLRPYIREELRNQDVVEDFFALILGDSPFSLETAGEVNVGVTSRALAGLRVMHRHLRKAGDGKIPSGRIGGSLANVHYPQGRVNGERPRLDRATAQQLVDRCSADAKALDEAFFGRPLMQEALQKNLDQAGDIPIDLTPSLYFAPVERKRLNALSRDLAGLLQTEHESWSIYDNIRRGQISPTEEHRQHLANKRGYLDEIERHLSEIAEILRG